MQVSGDNEAALERLHDQKQALTNRLRELEQHRILTSAEKVELDQLRQMRHQTQERILQLQRN